MERLEKEGLLKAKSPNNTLLFQEKNDFDVDTI